MRLNVVMRAAAVGALGLLIAGCGGGGSNTSTPTSTLELDGTSAVGAALAGANVDVKCASGTGNTTTTSTGYYNVSMQGGELPCIVRVTGTTASGAAVTLHSVVDTGDTTGDTTKAKANVTPVTEMIVAQLLETMPADAFSSFEPQRVTQAALDAATTTIVDALKAAGVDLGDIDPLKDSLVPANGDTAGNTYDQMLDQLGAQVTPETLPLFVTQIATAAASDTPTAPVISSLNGCPVAVSGKYRTIDYLGATRVHTVDFKSMTWQTEGMSSQAIDVTGVGACEFKVGATRYAIGDQGAGLYQTAAAGMIGYLFPVQSHPLSSIVGTWRFLESGLDEQNAGAHWLGNFTVDAQGSASVCDYDAMNGVDNFKSCVTADETMAVRAASDGSFVLAYNGTDESRLFGYKGPNGTLALFGTNNPTGSTSTTALRSNIVMTKPHALTLPAVGNVTNVFEAELVYSAGTLTSNVWRVDSSTVTAVDTAASTMTKTRASDGRVDVTSFNYPVEGLRYRAPTTGISSVYSLPLGNLGVTATIDNMPSHFYVITVRRP